MDWACLRFAASTPRNSCRASFRRMLKSSAPERRRSRACTTRRGASSPLLAVVRTSADELLAVLPRELAPARSLNDCASSCCAARWSSKTSRISTACSAARTPAPPPGIASLAWGTRRLLLVPRDRLASSTVADAAALARWQMRRHRRRTAAGLRSHQRSFRGADAQPRLVRRHRLRQGLLHRPGSHRARALPRPGEAQAAALVNGSGVALKPADTARGPDGRAFSVVRVAARPDGQQEILAVGNFAAVIEPARGNVAGHRSRERGSQRPAAAALLVARIAAKR